VGVLGPIIDLSKYTDSMATKVFAVRCGVGKVFFASRNSLMPARQPSQSASRQRQLIEVKTDKEAEIVEK
jgi:hypothetical protein